LPISTIATKDYANLPCQYQLTQQKIKNCLCSLAST